MAATKVTTKVLADDAVTIDKINDSVLVTELEGISSNDNDTTIPTSAAVKDYVDTEVAGLVDSAPATLDTLNELAAALGDDANFSTTITNSIGLKQDAATALTTSTNFGGDVTGAYNAIVIADDSHNHVIANVDGLQNELDSKVDGTGTAGTLPKLSDQNTITDSAISESGQIIDINTTGAIRVPDGTTAERPVTPVAGMFRYNTTDGQFEGYTTEWGAIAGSGGAGGGSVDVVTTQHSGDGSTQGFALDSTPGDNDAVQVYLNGVYQVKDAANYSISGSTLTFVTPPTNSTAIEFVHFKITAGGGGGISWDTTVKTSAFTAIAGEGYFVNTTSAAITVTLPSSPSAGDEVSIVDYAGTADTNNITITSSDNINGSSNDVKINYERGGVSMVYVDATQGWIAYNAANETAAALATTPLIVDYLVIAGGGGGGYANAGGAGAGGYRNSFNSEPSGGGNTSESALTLVSSTNYTITVGAGGAGGTSGQVLGSQGFSSVFAGINTVGGGYGGIGFPITAGGIGGSGGGGGGASGSNISGGQGTTDQGYNGGNNALAPNYPSGGGGGAGGAGGAGSGSQSGAGGIGLSSNITNTPTLRGGGGGGGGTIDGSTAGGATSGGGAGGNSGSVGTDGANNTGGGGGGGYHLQNGGTGGSGVVILRYPSTYTITETTSAQLTFTTDESISGEKVTVFTAGDGTIEFS